MGKRTYNTNLAANICRRNPCRIAYSLNNTQPVSCTIISDQPFFYMDAEIPLEEDDLFYEEDYERLHEDLRALRHKIDSYDRLSADFLQSSDQTTQDFVLNSADICSEEANIEENPENIDDLLNIVSQSRFAAGLMESADAHKVRIRLSTQVSKSFYDREAGIIFIGSGLEKEDQLLLLSMELRRHWQHRQGALLDPLAFHPDQAILVQRAQNADLAAHIIRIAWELQLAGHKEIWERVENSSFSDLGRALAREAHLDFRTLNNGQASAAVFETWFLSERYRDSDKSIIQRMLTDSKGYMFGCEQSSRTVSADLIVALGSVPFGKNYLAQYAQMILSDPIFTDVRDRSNANFLWFIKFEQSFHEAEQELQTSDPTISQDFPLGIIRKIMEDTDHDARETNLDAPGVVVDHPRSGQFSNEFSGGQPGSRSATQLEGSGSTPNVIYVQFSTSD